MIELFLPIELGNQLKELGFKETCLAIKSSESDNLFLGFYKNSHTYYKEFTVILWQQAFDWFEKEFNLHARYTPNSSYEILSNNEYLEWKIIFKALSFNPKIDCLKKLIEYGKHKMHLLQ